MISVKAKIVGMPRLLRKLKVLPKVAQEEVRGELARQADEIVAMMKRLAPEDSGDLRRSIAWAWGNKVPKGAMAVATGGKGGLTITIYAGDAEAYYARWVEFGVRSGNASGRRATGQPFFYPSWRVARKPAKRKLREASRRAAQKVAAT